MNELINITLNENHEPVVIILDEEDDFDFVGTAGRSRKFY